MRRPKMIPSMMENSRSRIPALIKSIQDLSAGRTMTAFGTATVVVQLDRLETVDASMRSSLIRAPSVSRIDGLS